MEILIVEYRNDEEWRIPTTRDIAKWVLKQPMSIIRSQKQFSIVYDLMMAGF
jgi:hypothetical protein